MSIARCTNGACRNAGTSASAGGLDRRWKSVGVFVLTDTYLSGGLSLKDKRKNAARIESLNPYYLGFCVIGFIESTAGVAGAGVAAGCAAG